MNQSFDNNYISDVLERLGNYYRTDKFRAKAYTNACKAIKDSDIIITSGKQAQKDIKGVGASVAAKIDEILRTGTTSILKDYEEKDDGLAKEKAISTFVKIHGVGAKTAEKWVNQGYRTLEDIKCLYYTLTHSQKLGYYYYHHLNTRITRKEMDLIANRLAELFTLIDSNIEYEICGSYRRGCDSSGDIDVLIKWSPKINLTKIVSLMTKQGFIIGHLSHGKTKYLGICRLSDGHNARRIDLMIVDSSSWWYAILYFTGSQKLNIMMRSRAIEKGLSLSEHGLTGNNKIIKVNSEKEIFAALDMEYLEPTERNL